MRSVLERMARAGHPPLHSLPPAQARAAYEAGSGVLDLPNPVLDRVEDLDLPVRDGSRIPARLYAPAGTLRPIAWRRSAFGFSSNATI